MKNTEPRAREKAASFYGLGIAPQLLQILDNGRLTDAKGRVVNFRNTVIILTSNIGAQHIDRMQKMGFSNSTGETEDYQNAKEKVMLSLKEYFRPEFLNRLDDIIVFDILTKEAIQKIVDLQISIVKDRLKAKEIQLEVTPIALEYLTKEGYNPQYGARPLKRLIQNRILTSVASLMISKDLTKGGTVVVDFKDKEFTFEVKKLNKKGNVIDEIISEGKVAEKVKM